MYRIVCRRAFIKQQMSVYGGIDPNIDITDGLWVLFMHLYDWYVSVLFFL